MRGETDFFHVLPCAVRDGRVGQHNAVQPDDGIHRCADLVAHVGQEGSLRPVRSLRRNQGIAQRFALFQRPSHFFVDIHKAHAHRVDQMVIPILWMPDSGKANHLIAFPPVSLYHISVGDHQLFPQAFTDCVWLYEIKESASMLLNDVLFRICCKGIQIRKMLSDLEPFLKRGMRLVAYPLVFVQFQIIDTPVV